MDFSSVAASKVGLRDSCVIPAVNVVTKAGQISEKQARFCTPLLPEASNNGSFLCLQNQHYSPFLFHLLKTTF
jgi:hypothetical protein